MTFLFRRLLASAIIFAVLIQGARVPLWAAPIRARLNVRPGVSGSNAAASGAHVLKVTPSALGSVPLLNSSLLSVGTVPTIHLKNTAPSGVRPTTVESVVAPSVESVVLPSRITAASPSKLEVVSQAAEQKQHPAGREMGRWSKLKKATAGLWKPSAGASSAYTLGHSIQGFLTGTRAHSDSGEVPFEGGVFGGGLRPEFRLSPALHNKKLKPLESAPPTPKKEIQHQARRTAAPVEESGGFNPLVWALKPFVDFFRLALLQEAHRPNVISAVLAAAVLAPIPYVGFVAVHELGHYLAARFLGVPAGTVRYYAMDGIKTDDGRFIVRGYVVTARWEKPWKLYWVTLTG
ncbi:MAG: hypothetical protein V3S11_06545, partial [Elusimicrobiota bacterium]